MSPFQATCRRNLGLGGRAGGGVASSCSCAHRMRPSGLPATSSALTQPPRITAPRAFSLNSFITQRDAVSTWSETRTTTRYGAVGLRRRRARCASMSRSSGPAGLSARETRLDVHRASLRSGENGQSRPRDSLTASRYTGVDRRVPQVAEQLKRPLWPVLHGDP
jgi:hypothetical protein